ncbi:MAG: hypothetical protein VCA37_13615 [Roseibacillus sp.]
MNHPTNMVALFSLATLLGLALVLPPSVALSAPAETAEHVIMAGGPALQQWERLGIKARPHDKWWANFVRASTLSMLDLRREFGKDARITWIVYRPRDVTRGQEDQQPFAEWIKERAHDYRALLIWVDSGPQTIAALNSRPTGSILIFDYFGHSNPHAFMLDYGNEILGVSKAWIHERGLAKIRRSVFSPQPRCKNWGCHTGQSMSLTWRQTLGIHLIGAEGKTDYGVVSQRALLPNTNGRWMR